jgi:hypothetical protein
LNAEAVGDRAKLCCLFALINESYCIVWSTCDYIYQAIEVNIKGRGNLGFGWIEKKDLQSNKLTRTEYNQSYPYAAQVECRSRW